MIMERIQKGECFSPVRGCDIHSYVCCLQVAEWNGRCLAFPMPLGFLFARWSQEEILPTSRCYMCWIGRQSREAQEACLSQMHWVLVATKAGAFD